MNTTLRSTLLTLIAALAGLGCDEQEQVSFVSLSTAQVCELAARGRNPSEDECETLCHNDSVDECSMVVSINATRDLCSNADAKTSTQPVADALMCTVVSLEFESPFASHSVEGRRPEGFVAARSNVADLGTYFASCHELEAASIDAFERLARELAAFGAPATLVERARAAKADEIRHARWTAILARAHGGEPGTVAPAPLSVRGLFEMALENAIEGVVRETFGAARALFRAASIPDRRARRVMTRIAEDELRHAELSWDVAAFAAAHLPLQERETIAAAMQTELGRLERATGEAPSLRREAGLPNRQATARIVETLRVLLDAEPFARAA